MSIYRLDEVEKDLWKSSSLIPVLRAGSAKASRVTV